MAVQMSTFLSGRMENVIFYKRSGRYFAKAAPVKVQQSVSTKMRSKNFGMASSAGRILRQLLEPALPFPKDKNMQSRFSGTIAKWLGLTDTSTLQPEPNLPYVNGFSFNEATSISARWKLPLTVTVINSGLLQVTIPAFAPSECITAPANTASIDCTIIGASCKLGQNAAQGSCIASVFIPYNNTLISEQIIPLTIPAGRDYLAVTAISFTYLLNNGEKVTRPVFMPCQIIDARYC